MFINIIEIPPQKLFTKILRSTRPENEKILAKIKITNKPAAYDRNIIISIPESIFPHRLCIKYEKGD